jgi:chloride channel 2
VYAIVGAAALGGAVTRTVSIAMIVFEMIGQTSHMVPLLVGTLMAYAVSNALSISIYDALLEIKNLPFLPTLSGMSTYSLTAKDLINENFLYLTKDSKLADVAIIITKLGFTPATIPVVESETKK